MIYKFKSRATGELTMLGVHGDELLGLLGKEPNRAGIVELADLPVAISLIEAALAQEAAHQHADSGDADLAKNPSSSDTVSLRQRAWPLLEMMRRAYHAKADIVWET